jgi:hypothetical protein
LNIALVSIIDTAFFVGIPGGNYFSLFFLAFLILLFPSVSGSLKSINRITTKVACISGAKSPIYVASSVGALFAIIVPAAMLPFGESVLYLNPDQFLSFILAAVGAVIMLAAEILLSSLCKKFGPEVSFENRRRILGGTYVFEWVEDTITEPDFELID